MVVPWLQVSQIRAGMSLPLLGLALDRTPLLPLQLMNGVLPLLLVLQVSNLLVVLGNHVYQMHLSCHITSA